MSVDYEPLLPAHWADPYESYRRLRDEAPVHWAPQSELWCVSRYEDVAQVLRTPEDFSSEGVVSRNWIVADLTLLRGSSGSEVRRVFDAARGDRGLRGRSQPR